MSRLIKTSLVILLVLAFLPAMPVQAQTNADCQYYGTHSSGAKYCITMPPLAFWNGDLVIFAHGYVAVNEPLDIPWSQMVFSDGMGGVITTPFLVNSLGYAFATTSYSENGLVVQQGILDILSLIKVFKTEVGTPGRIYLVGASEGGLVTTLAMERYPVAFTGGLATCGPIGDFRGQVDYWGDFRVIFDYMMDTPTLDVLPGTAVTIPKSLMAKWDSYYAPLVGSVLVANPSGTGQLFSVTHAAYDAADPLTMGETTLGILWYNVFATHDAILKLGGQPFDNRERVYSGSFDDTLLNQGVKRFSAKSAALENIANYYETSGIFTRPLVTMHTTGDPIVPSWHQSKYGQKVIANNPFTPYYAMSINRYGHCSFSLAEIVTGFSTLVYMSTGEILSAPAFIQAQGLQAESYLFAQ
jgi:pimeloyl-ACP methyl ester carboxylesterase